MYEGQGEGVCRGMSSARDVEVVAQDLARQLIHPHLGFVLFFCSAEYDLPALAEMLERYFGGIDLVGCTTAGEITPAGYGRGCVSAVGFDVRSFAISSALIDEMERFSLLDAQQMVETLVAGCRRGGLAPIKDHSFALTLLDGLSSREEVVLAALGAALGAIPHFGGSAGDDRHLTHTHVYHQGQFHTGAAVVVLVNTWLDFEVFTTHHVVPRAEKLVVTRADSGSRRVHELNAEPAALEYARLVGVAPQALDFALFSAHPLAVRVDERYYVRSIQQANEDLSLTFYCAVENGIVLTAMSTGPLLPNLEAQFRRLHERLGPPLLTIGCDCFLRRLELEVGGDTQATAAFLRSQQVIGFNTYGEQFNGMHINQTFTGVAIGRPREVSVAELQARVVALEEERHKLQRINQALIGRIESSAAQSDEAYGAFQYSVVLAEQVRERTDALSQTMLELKASNQLLSDARLRAETAHQHLLDAIESISDAFVLFDPQQRIVLFNERFRALWIDSRARIGPGMRRAELHRLARSGGLIVEEQRGGDQQTLYRLRDERWLRMSERPTRDGGLAVLYSDVTEIKLSETARREQALAQKSHLLQRAVDNLSQGVAMVGADGVLELWNRRFLELCGLAPIAGHRAFAEVMAESELPLLTPRSQDSQGVR